MARLIKLCLDQWGNVLDVVPVTATEPVGTVSSEWVTVETEGAAPIGTISGGYDAMRHGEPEEWNIYYERGE